MSFSGMAGWFSMVKGPLSVTPKSGFLGAAVARVPTEVNIELQQVGQPSDILGASRLTAGQGSERIEIDRLFALRNRSTGVQESRVAQFIVGVIRDVLGHIAIEVAQGGDVGWIAPLHSSPVRCTAATDQLQ